MKGPSDSVRIASKQAIALLRREGVSASGLCIRDAEKTLITLAAIFKKNKDLSAQGFYKDAVEEYVEAKVYYNFLSGIGQKFPTRIEIGAEEMVGGICDFTGELVRRAITIANADTFKEVARYQKVVEEIAGELSKIGFEGKLRSKYDDVERNLQKIETILYDIRLKKSTS